MPDPNVTLQHFCYGVMKPLQPVHDLVRERDGSPSWGILFDADECPAPQLPYLAQYPGCVLTPEMTEEQIRNEIRQPTGWGRGWTESIEIATRRTLAPVEEGEALLVLNRPRTPEAGRHYVRTLLAQTPDPARTEAVIRAATPLWDVLDYEAIDGVSYADIAAGWSDYEELRDAFPNYAAIRDMLPDELPE